MRVEEVLRLIKGRRSVREFTKDPVSDDELLTLMDVARYAPSNSNRQAWKFIVLRSRPVIEKIATAVRQEAERLAERTAREELRAGLGAYLHYFLIFSNAPVVIVALYKRTPSALEGIMPTTLPPAELISLSMAVQNLLLAAHAMGLGACCTTGPLIAVGEIRRILDIRPPFELGMIIPVGRYATAPEPPARKEISRIMEVLE
ncbi:MAG: nitroreductase family protein [Nitrospirales bacterium]|nr:nitroreductase family protein [Nitrospirales bacterium]